MDDRRELLKLKQGLVTEEESSLELEKTHIIKPTGMAAVENFWYHNKFIIIAISFFVIVAGIMVFLTLTEEKADLTVLLISDNLEASEFFHFERAELQRTLEHFTPDFNENGNVFVNGLVIDLTTHIGDVMRSQDMIHGARVKLFAEVQHGNSLIFIGNKEALAGIPEGVQMPVEDFYEELFADEEGESVIFYPVKGSPLDEIGVFEKIPVPDDLYIALRKKNVDKENELIVLENIFENVAWFGQK
jgi:hypothetical protein